MFKTLVSTMKSFDEKMIKAHENFEKERNEITRNYNGELLQKRLEAVSQEFEQTKISEVTYLKNVIKVEFDRLFKKMSDIVTAPVPGDFTATLEVIKANPKNILNYEAKIYIEKYKDNYVACRGIVNALHEAGLTEDIQMIYADFVQMKLDECYRASLDFINNYQSGSLSTALDLSDKSSIFVIVEQQIQPFFDKNFVNLRQQGEEYERYSY